MQLSLPNTLQPDAVRPVPNFPGMGPIDPAREAFESFLPDGLPTTGPFDSGTKPAAEEAAAVVAAAFWLPLVPPPLPATTSPTGVDSTATESLAPATEMTWSNFPPASLPGPAARESGPGFSAAPSLRIFTIPPGNEPIEFKVPNGRPDVMVKAVSNLPVATKVPGDPAAEAARTLDPVVAAAVAGAAIRLAPSPSRRPVSPSVPLAAADLVARTELSSGAGVSSTLTDPSSYDRTPVSPGQTAAPPESIPESRTAASGAVIAAATCLEEAPKINHDRPNGNSRRTLSPLDTAPGMSSPTGLAKIAGRESGSGEFDQGLSYSNKKEFLSPAGKRNTDGDVSLGIDVARASPNMPDSPSSRSMTSDSVATTPVAALPMVVAVSARSPSPAAVPGATLHHTMAAVVAAVESLDRRDSTQARQVDFQFQVGHEQLSLRLELKAGTIQATFHTNSTELRHALTHEWEAVMPTTIGSGLSVAQPVFSSSPGDGTNSTFGSFPQGGAQERGQPEPERPAHGRRPDYAAGARSDAAPTEVSLPNVLSLLNTFA